MRDSTGGAGPGGWLAAVPPAAVLVAAVLAAGCSGAAHTSYQATTATCYAFSVQALQRHVTVTSAPPACAGLSHEQVDLAVTRAVREVVGPRSKATGRRLAHREISYLVHLIKAVPVPKSAPQPAAPTQRSAGLPLRLAALAAWAVTAAAGSWLLAGWLAQGGLRRRHTQAAGVPRVVIVGHFALAVAGLGMWIAFMATGVSVLAWIAVGVVLSVAGLGMATLVGGLPDTAASAGPAGPADPTGPAGPGGPAGPARPAGPAGPGLPPAGRTAVLAAPAEVRKPVTVIAVHGMLAAATILLVVLAAIGAP